VKRKVLLLFILILCSRCNEKNPIRPQNNSPQILSLIVFPSTVRPMDSLIVICDAIDPDEDTLVYDLITGGQVKIKCTNEFHLYNTSENSHIFYAPDSILVPVDSFGVQCAVRDIKGGIDMEMVFFKVANLIVN